MERVTDPDLLAVLNAPPEALAPASSPGGGMQRVTDPALLAQLNGDAPASGQPGDASAAVGRGLIEGIPILGAPLMGAVNRGVAGIRALKNDTRYSDELKNVEQFGERTAAEHPYASTAGELAGGVIGTAPLMAAAPAAFGAGAGSLGTRIIAGGLSGAGLGGADSAVRSGGDLGEVKKGALIGGTLGAAAPLAGYGIGRVAEMATGGAPGQNIMREALAQVPPDVLDAAQAFRAQASVPVTLGEAIQRVSNGAHGGRVAQIERVVAASGGKGGQIMGEFYGARPGQVDDAAQGALNAIGERTASPTDLGFEVQAGAQRGVAQTPPGAALQAAQDAAGPRVTAMQAGDVSQSALARRVGELEAARSAEADPLYAAGRNAPETVGMEGRPVTVERPGEPIVEPQQYSQPQFTPDAPAPMAPASTAGGAAAVEAGPESLARYVARNGGIRLDGDAAATDLHRFNIPGLGNVARPTGRGVDDFWREELIAKGYLRPDADGGAARDITSELLRKLQNEQRGFPSYPIGSNRALAPGASAGQVADDYAATKSLAQSRMREDLTQAGINPDAVHPAIQDRIVGALARGEHQNGADAYEAVANSLREPPAPKVTPTTVTEELPTVRWGQVDPRPAMRTVAEQSRTAKDDVLGAQNAIAGMLRGPDGAPDMSVAGLLHARERIDFRISQAREVGDNTKVRDLTITRRALDDALKQVPEVAAADAAFAQRSVPLEPFQGNGPLAQATRREGNQPNARLMMPAEQVPGTLLQPSALRETLNHAPQQVGDTLGRRLQTVILDGTQGGGSEAAATIRQRMLQHEDALAQLPEVRERVNNVALAHEGMARVEASPLGLIARQPDVEAATSTLFSREPRAGSEREVGAAMGALARNNPRAAEQLVRFHLENVFNAATAEKRGLPAQYGGAAFASFVRGNSQAARNFEAAVRALPDGNARWTGLSRVLDAFEATGYRPQRGSDTAFNMLLQKELASGKTPFGQAMSNALAGAGAGMMAGGVKGAIAGGAVGIRHGLSDALTHARMLKNSEAVARLVTDPAMVPDLRALAKAPPHSRSAELFTARLVARANGSLAPIREPAGQHRAVH